MPLAGFSSVIGSLVPQTVAALANKHPGLEIDLTNTQPPEALELLRTGKIDVAIIFRYDETEPEPKDVRLHHLFDDPLYLVSARPGHTLTTLRDATWIAGCDRCRSHLLSMCAVAGFDPKIGYSSDDMVVMQALVAAGLGVATQTGCPCAPTASRASSPPNCPAPSATSTPRPTASRPIRPPPPSSWQPSQRPPRWRSPPPARTSPDRRPPAPH